MGVRSLAVISGPALAPSSAQLTVLKGSFDETEASLDCSTDCNRRFGRLVDGADGIWACRGRAKLVCGGPGWRQCHRRHCPRPMIGCFRRHPVAANPMAGVLGVFVVSVAGRETFTFILIRRPCVVSGCRTTTRSIGLRSDPSRSARVQTLAPLVVSVFPSLLSISFDVLSARKTCRLPGNGSGNLKLKRMRRPVPRGATPA